MASDALVNQLVTLMQTQEPEAALVELEKAAQNEGAADPRVLLLLAGQYASLGRMDAAEASYASLLQIAPAFAIARFQLGLLQFTSGRPAVAMVSWAPLEQLPQEHYLRSFVQGFWHLARDEFEEARMQLLEGMARNDENLPLNGDMRMVLDNIEALRPQNMQEAVQDDAGSNHVLLSGYTRLH
ncbi:MAG: hypothetical protein QM639_02165 [Rhodocyclaceae bacterium]